MSSTPESIRLEDWIRDIPDFPQRGVLFKDITPLLQNSEAFHAAMDRLAAHYAGAGIQTVVGVESRGFIFGAVLAYLLNCGFVPVRKFGKLPYQTVTVEYELEYGFCSYGTGGKVGRAYCWYRLLSRINLPQRSRTLPGPRCLRANQVLIAYQGKLSFSVRNLPCSTGQACLQEQASS